MSEFNVEIEFTGVYTRDIDADSDDEASDEALDELRNFGITEMKTIRRSVVENE